MAKFTAYKVVQLPTSNIDDNGLYFLKDGNRYIPYLRHNSQWVEDKSLKAGDNISELTNDSGFVSNSEDTYSQTPKANQIVTLKEGEYDALSVKDENTLYIIIED